MRTPDVTAQELSTATAELAALRDAMRAMIVGHEAVVDGVIHCVIAGGHALLEGVPGLGKTLLVRTLAQALGLDFSRVQFTPDLQPKDIIGTLQLQRTEDGADLRVFEPGPLFAHLVLADEINRATPRTQSALLEAMAEGAVTVGRQTHVLAQPFFVLATQNPLEQDGTYPLPEAQLDRFLCKLQVQFPTLDELDEIMRRTITGETPQVPTVLDRAGVLRLQAIARRVAIAPSQQRWALRMLQRTHPTTPDAPASVRRYVREGASPRGAQAILATARVSALLRGETMVADRDIRQCLVPALRHRLLLNFEGEAEAIDRDALLDEIMRTTPRSES